MRNERTNLFQILIILLFAALVLYALDYARQLDSIRGPVEGVMIALRINEREEAPSETELAAHIASLTAENDLLTKEIEALQSQIDAESDMPFKLVPAYVVSIDKDTDDRTMLIAKGSDDGLSISMPVVVESVLIGTIESTTPRLSHVRLLSSSESRVTVKTSSKARGLAGGTATGHGLTSALLDRVLQEEVITEKDLVRTSGEDGIPENLLVGSIARDLSEDRAPFQQAEIQLAVDPAELDQVFVIR